MEACKKGKWSVGKWEKGGGRGRRGGWWWWWRKGIENKIGKVNLNFGEIIEIRWYQFSQLWAG